MDYLSNLDTLSSDNLAASLTHWSAHSRIDTSESNDNESLLLINQLQTTLDVTLLLSIFFNHIGSSYKVHSLEFEANNLNVKHGSSRAKEHRVILPLFLGRDVLGQVSYFSSRQLSSLMVRALKDLQNTLYYPMKNAIAFYNLQQLAMKDTLTGADNRSSYEENVSRAILSAKRHARPFVLMLMDLDNFKQVNDNYGHQSGDQVLKTFTEQVQQCLRGTDQLFRFGGDEFAVILDQEATADAEAVANRLAESLSKSLLSRHYKIGVSIGFTQYNDNDTADTLFARADQALYAAKNAGKNCFKCA